MLVISDQFMASVLERHTRCIHRRCTIPQRANDSIHSKSSLGSTSCYCPWYLYFCLDPPGDLVNKLGPERLQQLQEYQEREASKPAQRESSAVADSGGEAGKHLLYNNIYVCFFPFFFFGTFFC